MALPVFNWVDNTNYPTGPENVQQQWLILRITNDLYLLAFSASTTAPLIYKSSNSGVLWALFDNTALFSGQSGSGLYFAYKGTDGLIRIISSGASTSNVELDELDTSGPTWTGPANFGGGFNKNQVSPNIVGPAGFGEYRRNDGSRVIAHQTTQGGGWDRIRILKETGGTWTSLALISDASASNVLHSFHVDASENVHLFGQKYDGATADLWHVSVSAADAVSSRHTIDTGIETSNPASVASGRCDISADGNTLIYAYAKDGFGGYSSNAVTVKIAICDISTTPLSPSFTVEAVASSVNPGVLSFGSTAGIACSFQGTNTAHVYFMDGSALVSPKKANLKHSVRTGVGTWSAPDFIWDKANSPAVNPPIASNRGIDGFDLLNAFTGDVGILVGIFSSPNVYIGYAGPAIPSGRKNNYASAGGSMACKGNYAAAG